MAIKTISQEQLGQDTVKNSQVVTTAVKNFFTSGITTSSGPVITSVIVTDSGYNNLDDTVATTSNSYVRILGTGYQSTANVFLNGNMIPKANITFVSATELRAQLPVSNTGNYVLSVFNSNSAGGLYSSSFVISTMPQWLTSANLTSIQLNETFSTSLSATSDSTINYSNTTSLPAGTTLLSNGYFYGSISTPGTYTFDVKANDSENQDSIKTFNLNIVQFNPSNLNNLVAWHDLTSLGDGVWNDKTGISGPAIFYGTAPAVQATSGNGSIRITQALTGTTTSKVTWPDTVLPSTYTLFHVTRYSGSNRQRIFTGATIGTPTPNWLSGFWFQNSGGSGVAYHGAWITSQSDKHGSNWVLSTDQNSLYRSNGVDRTIAAPGSPSYARLAINSEPFLEPSDWQVVEVIVYNRTLNNTEILQIEEYLNAKYGIY
jgi:hypothetical protein